MPFVKQTFKVYHNRGCGDDRILLIIVILFDDVLRLIDMIEVKIYFYVIFLSLKYYVSSLSSLLLSY